MDKELPLESLIKRVPIFSALPSAEIKVKKLAGLTNNNYHLEANNQKYVLRVPRQSTNKNINRNHEAHNADIAYQLGLAPKVLWREEGQGGFTGLSLVVAIDQPRTLMPTDWNDAETVNAIADSLRFLQGSKHDFKGKLDHQSIAKHLNNYFQLCSTQQQEELQTELQQALKLLEDIKRHDRKPVPSHIDLVSENILQGENRIWLIDWEYSAMASPFWDIATIMNMGFFNEKKALDFLKSLIPDYTENDCRCLKKYQSIVSSISYFWSLAYLDQF